jgi:hypothetical protein
MDAAIVSGFSVKRPYAVARRIFEISRVSRRYWIVLLTSLEKVLSFPAES